MDLKLLDTIPEEVIVELVESVGGVEHRRDEKHIWFSTICHHGDSDKLCFNRDSKKFYCYTNCGAMGVADFVMQVFNISLGEAVVYLQRLLPHGIETSYQSSKEYEELREFLDTIRLKDEAFEVKELITHALECFEDNVFYEGWIDEGISIETMQEFGIRWDEITKSIIIPHFNIDGKLVGIRTRQIEAVRAKYMPLTFGGDTYSHPLGMNLYGLNLHKKGIKKSRQALVVESEKSVMKHHTWYGSDSNAVAVCGFNMTSEQRRLLLGLDVEEVVLAFDHDVPMNVTEDTITEEYERYCEVVNRIGQALAPYCRVTVLVDEQGLLGMKDSPLDCGQEVFLELMKIRQEIVC